MTERENIPWVAGEASDFEFRANDTFHFVSARGAFYLGDDAKKVTRAARSYDDLVAALRRIADKITPRMRKCLQEDWAYEEIDVTKTDWSVIDAALAKATKESA